MLDRCVEWSARQAPWSAASPVLSSYILQDAGCSEEARFGRAIWELHTTIFLNYQSKYAHRPLTLSPAWHCLCCRSLQHAAQACHYPRF